MQSLSAEPPLDTDMWEDAAEISFYATARPVRIYGENWPYRDGEHIPEEEIPALTTGPGWCRARAYAKGRDILFDLVAETPVETYLIQCWPAQPTAPRAIKVTSETSKGYNTS